MTMIYIASIRSTTSASFKRWAPTLLVVPFCALLASCDTASSNTNKDMMTKSASVETVQGANLQDAAESSQSDEQRRLDKEAAQMAEGQSLIAAAQANSEAQTLAAAARNTSTSSMLQATLMGDYGGMVPCPDCDSIDVTLNLFADGSVLKASTFQNTEQPREPLLESGIYRQDNDQITIVYENKNIETYRIQDNHLILINEQNNLDNDYTLSRK